MRDKLIIKIPFLCVFIIMEPELISQKDSYSLNSSLIHKNFKTTFLKFYT